MVKLRFILATMFLISASSPMLAGWKVVIDKNCVKVVTSNTASQKLIENQHNQRLDSIASKKKKVELYSVSMATIKELYKLTMENVSGFGTESRYYKEIGSCAFDILKDVPELIKIVNQAKFTNKLYCLGTGRFSNGNAATGGEFREYREQCQGAESAQRSRHSREEERWL